MKRETNAASGGDGHVSSGLDATSAVRWTTLILCVAALYVCWPLWPAIALAGWTAAIVHPMVARLERALNGRRRAAGLLVFLVFLLVATPLALYLVFQRMFQVSLPQGVVGQVLGF